MQRANVHNTRKAKTSQHPPTPARENIRNFLNKPPVIGAAAPVFVMGSAAMGADAPGGARAGVAAVGVAGSAVGLSLLGRRSMKAASLLDLSGGGGAVTLFFDIAAVAVGTHYVIAGQNPTSGLAYLAASVGGVTAGGLQLRQNRFIADMRTDPRVYLTPTGAVLVGQF